MDIQNDIYLSYELLDASVYSWQNLLEIAVKGSEEQRDILLTWAAGNLAHFMWKELVYAAGRVPECDYNP